MSTRVLGGVLGLLLVTALGVATASASTIFADKFDKTNGALGTGWIATNGLGLPAATISSNEACADDHGFAKFAISPDATNVRTSFSFHAAANENFELYAVALNSSGTVFIAGCDGGASTACTPKVGQAGGSSVTGTPIPMTVGTTYGLIAVFNAGQITVTITDSVGVPLGSATTSTAQTFTEYGFLVGRQSDSNLTCINNFLLEDLDSTAAFSDDFSRADGAIGGDWASVGPPEFSIVTGRACGSKVDVDSSGSYDAWSEDVDSQGSITAQVDFSNATANDHDVAVTLADLPNRYLRLGLEWSGSEPFLSVETGVPGAAPNFSCSPSAGLSLASGTSYRLTAHWDPDGTSVATLTDDSGLTVLAQVACNTGGVIYSKVVLSAGSQAIGGTTCADNFLLYAQPAGAPVDCVVSAFGACSQPCGGGTQTRTVITPASGGGAACPALSQACNTQSCDNLGFVPTTKDILKCEKKVAKRTNKAETCITKCQSTAAADVMFDRPTCETNCLTAYSDGTQALLDKAICPACLDSAGEHSAPAGAAQSTLDGIRSQIYCAASPSEDALKCEQTVGKGLLKYGKCLDNCHAKSASKLFAAKTFDETACRTGCRAKYDKGTTKLVDAGTCPTCLGSTQQGTLATQLQTARRSGYSAFYCQGTVPIP